MNFEVQIILCAAEMNVVRRGNDFLRFPLFSLPLSHLPLSLPLVS